MTDNRINSLSIILKPTEACNLNCQYCYAKKFRDEYGNGKMSDEILDRMLTLCEDYAKEIQIVWHGGEPTLMGVDWYYHVQDIIKKHTKSKITQCLQTNGTLLNKEWGEMAKVTGISFGVSYDVFDQEIRQANATYDVAKNLEDFNSVFEQGGAGTISVINKESYDKLIDIYEYFKQNFGHDPAFNYIFNTSDEEDVHLLGNSKEFMDSFSKFAKYVINDTSAGALSERTLTNTMKIIGGGRDILCTNIDCTRGWIGICFNGDLYPCDQPHYKCGNVYDFNSIEEVYNSEGYIQYLKDLKTRIENNCSKCSYFQYCLSGCHSNHIAATGTNSKVDKDYCALFQLKFYDIYMIMRDIDIYTPMNPKILKLLLMQPIFTIKEIKEIMSENDIDFDFNENLTVGNLIQSKEFKIFALFNPYQGRKLNNHINFSKYGSIYFNTDDMEKVKENRQMNLKTAFNREKENILKVIKGEM